ncbi:unnamed protein product [Mytilus coruscus]|uniref:Uncharacterized protein n=1 Tax=Mytilus coruscus TaxID=42192 RepID=A0A6J8BF91_MYTCO|nr:unnamed protein product [Mytilus coruscus]
MRAVRKTFMDGRGEAGNMADTHPLELENEATQRTSARIQNGGTNNQDGDGVNNKDGHDVNNKDGGAHQSNPRSEDAYVQEILKMMCREKNSTGQYVNDSHNSSTGRDNLLVNDIYSWKDPQIFLKSTNFDPNVNFFDITDFVPNTLGGHSESEELVSESSGGKLVFKSGSVKPKLETLSVTQWSMANLSIMHKLIAIGELQSSQIMDYLSYTMRIYLFISSCELVSVFVLDREYRRLQKQHQFR